MMKQENSYYVSEYLVTTKNLLNEDVIYRNVKPVHAARVSNNYKYLVCTAIITLSYWSLCKNQETLKYKDEIYSIVE